MQRLKDDTHIKELDLGSSQILQTSKSDTMIQQYIQQANSIGLQVVPINNINKCTPTITFSPYSFVNKYLTPYNINSPNYNKGIYVWIDGSRKNKHMGIGVYFA